MDKAYLQFGKERGPFYTVSAPLRHMGADRYLALFESKWRKVHVQVNRTYIVYQGEKVTIDMQGMV